MVASRSGLAGQASSTASDVRAPQRFLSPANADGVNDAAVFGPHAASVKIYDDQGRQIFEAVREGAPIVWNCRDGSGRLVNSGAYVARVEGDDGSIAYQSFAVVK